MRIPEAKGRIAETINMAAKGHCWTPHSSLRLKTDVRELESHHPVCFPEVSTEACEVALRDWHQALQIVPRQTVAEEGKRVFQSVDGDRRYTAHPFQVKGFENPRYRGVSTHDMQSSFVY